MLLTENVGGLYLEDTACNACGKLSGTLTRLIPSSYTSTSTGAEGGAAAAPAAGGSVACGSVLSTAAGAHRKAQHRFFFRLNWQQCQLEYFDLAKRKKWYGLTREPKVVWFLPAFELVENFVGAEAEEFLGPELKGELGAEDQDLSFALRGQTEQAVLVAPDRQSREQWVMAIRLAQMSYVQPDRA